jgi:predicted ATPase
MPKGPRDRENLPSPASSFHGRRAELDAIDAAFETHRLVSVVGPGGMGKTRLAQQFAASRLTTLARKGRGGVWFVDLSQARTPHAAASAVASALHLIVTAHANEDPERGYIAAVGRAVAAMGPTLIVLDNLEQLGEPAAALLAGWLETTPSARWLVTSRIVLNLPAEQALGLGPLASDDARALFVDRARSVGTNVGDALVDPIVDAIDRMPLAIELAASRTRVMSAQTLRDRLGKPLSVLAADETTRHGSLRRTVLDSVALLPLAAARAFALLATLRNGFSLEAAEAVLAPLALPHAQTLDAIETLVRSSLLRVAIDGPHARYGFFETIREVAEERRECDEARDAARRAHLHHHLAIARSCAEVDEMLDGTFENFIVAAGTALAHGDATSALRLALVLDPQLSRRGLATQREQLLEGALTLASSARLDAALSMTDVAAAHLARGAARRERGDGTGAQQDFEAARALATELGDAGLQASALMRLGGIYDLRGDTEGARVHLARALSLLAETPEGEVRTAREAEALLRLGHAHRREGALASARDAITSAVARHRALGHDEGLTSCLYELGVIEMFRGERDRAFSCFDEGIEVARRGGVRVMEGACLTARGCLLQELGRLDEALAHHADAAIIFRDHGSALRHASALHYLATTYLERGAPGEAIAPLMQARRLLEGVGSPRYEVLTRCAWALALSALGCHDEAASAITPAARAMADVPNEPALAVALALHRATLAWRADPSIEGISEMDAEQRVAGAATDDSRFALRALSAARSGATSPSAEHHGLWVWGEGASFRAPRGERVQLPERSPLRRLLALLVDRREQTPGDPVTLEQLIAAGWPGEKIGADAALNRAYVGMTTLRKRGLGQVIVRASGGYAISRAITIHRMRDEPSGPGSRRD